MYRIILDDIGKSRIQDACANTRAQGNRACLRITLEKPQSFQHGPSRMPYYGQTGNYPDNWLACFASALHCETIEIADPTSVKTRRQGKRLNFAICTRGYRKRFRFPLSVLWRCQCILQRSWNVDFSTCLGECLWLDIWQGLIISLPFS